MAFKIIDEDVFRHTIWHSHYVYSFKDVDGVIYEKKPEQLTSDEKEILLIDWYEKSLN